MVTNNSGEEAIELLQELGLKEYEAKCFVGLCRLDAATAKQLSDVIEVPRTRIYDAIRVLEAQGLVEVQHSSPQRFRALPLSEATQTLRDQYETRVERLQKSLADIERIDTEEDSSIQEVWAMTGSTAIENRTNRQIGDASEEVVLVIGHAPLLTDELIDQLNDIGDGVDLLVGAVTGPLQERIHEAVPEATTFISGLEWLHETGDAGTGTSIGRLLLVDRSTILVSSVRPDTGEEQAIFGTGFGNGLVVIARRIMAQGLLTGRDPGLN